MAETKAPRSKPARKATAKKATAARARRKATTGARTGRPAANRARVAVDRTTELSEDLLRSVEDGQRAAIEAVHEFVDTVDGVLRHRGDGTSRRQELVDPALKMADRLVHTQYEFIRKVVDSAGKSLRR